LEKKADVDKKQTFSIKELKALAETITINDFTNLISKLNEEGVLLKTNKDTYKFIYYTS